MSLSVRCLISLSRSALVLGAWRDSNGLASPQSSGSLRSSGSSPDGAGRFVSCVGFSACARCSAIRSARAFTCSGLGRSLSARSACSSRLSSSATSLVLEIHIAHILDARGIEYEAQAKTENGKKPDFLFPSQAAYEDPAFPEEQLRMLASKTSIKDRFRQVADEANRIRDKHLFTLTPGDVTHPKLAQLDELHIHLVMPKVVKESYDDLIQGETMTFSRFIEEIQGLQADRPQSLTLL